MNRFTWVIAVMILTFYFKGTMYQQRDLGWHSLKNPSFIKNLQGQLVYHLDELQSGGEAQ